MKKLLLLLLTIFALVLFNCNNNKTPDTNTIINEYLSNHLGLSIKGNELFLLFAHKGCLNCNKAAFIHYYRNYRKSNAATIISSKRFLLFCFNGEIPDLNMKYVMDSTDRLDILNLPFSGASFVYMKDNKIDKIDNFTSQMAMTDSTEVFFVRNIGLPD